MLQIMPGKLGSLFGFMSRKINEIVDLASTFRMVWLIYGGATTQGVADFAFLANKSTIVY